jgi:fused signal recognition particle receptor
MEITEYLREREDELRASGPIKEALKAEMAELLGGSAPLVFFGDKPFVILAVGVNGTGKTTTIGKLASRFVSEGMSVILAASDTFRAAAIEQLDIWAERAGAQVIKHQSGSDPAAVAFDAVEAAKHRGTDVVIVDTAGRLHTKSPLMEELKKIRRVIGKSMPDAPQEVLLVVDATTGQNAIRQAQLFNEAVGVTGIALTKLDGTAKGGIVFAIRKELGIPVRLIGIGEGVDDLRDFDPAEFVEALFA